MKKGMKGCLVLLMCVLIPFGIAESMSNPAPMRLPQDKLEGKGLGEFAPWPSSMIISGESRHSLSELFNGEIVVGVYQSEPIKLNISTPWPFDELVMVQQGELQLHATGSDQPEIYPAGSMVIVPKGYTGTWEMLGDYREVWVVENNAYVASQEPGGLLSE